MSEDSRLSHKFCYSLVTISNGTGKTSDIFYDTPLDKYKVTKNKGTEDQVLKTVANRRFRFTLEKYLTDGRIKFHISQYGRSTVIVIVIVIVDM